MSRYLEFHASLSHDPQAEKFYEEQTNLLKTRLEASEGQLRDFQLKTGIGNLDEQKRALIARISDLQSTAAKTDAQISGDQQQVTDSAVATGQYAGPDRERNPSGAEPRAAAIEAAGHAVARGKGRVADPLSAG